jgi:CBS domain-containing protein
MASSTKGDTVIVRELLSGQVATCTPATTVIEAARRMVTDDVGSLAVTRAGRLVGIITERDVLRAVAAGGGPARRVSDVMTPDPDTLTPEVEVEEATDWMMAAGYRHLPVIEDDQLLGVVSVKDLMWALAERLRQPGWRS